MALGALVIGVAAAALLMIWTRAFYGSSEAHRMGEESLRHNRLIEAITYFDRAVHWYAPFNPYVEKSAQALWNLSETFEKRGDHASALAALTSLKSGYVAAAGLATPGRDWIKRCEARMEKLSQVENQEPRVTADRSEVEEKRSPNFISPPNVFWTLILEIGLLGWIGWVICMIARFRRKERALASYLKWGIPIILFYGMWIIGMMQA